jgi:hypothetical protein
MNLYFVSQSQNNNFVENNEQQSNFIQPNLEEIKKYLSPEFFTNLTENLNKLKPTFEENLNKTFEENVNNKSDNINTENENYNNTKDNNTKDNNTENENYNSENSNFTNNIEFPEFIVDLAKELSNEIEIPVELENISEPSELMAKMMQEDGQKMVMNLMNKVTTKLQKKIDSGQINQTQMKQQAEECLSNLMKANPAMKDMINQMVNGMGGAGASQFKQSQSKNDTKERLRQKLEKRKQQKQASQTNSFDPTLDKNLDKTNELNKNDEQIKSIPNKKVSKNKKNSKK